MQIAETEHLILRDFIAEDFPNLCELFGDPEVMRFGDGAKPADWVRKWLDDTLQNAATGDPVRPYAVIEKDGHCCIGYAGFVRFSDIGGTPEIELGYRLLRRKWKQGFGTEAATACLQYGFTELDLSRVISLIDPANHPSIRIAQSLGMVHEDNVMLDGYDHPDRVYAISKPNS